MRHARATARQHGRVEGTVEVVHSGRSEAAFQACVWLRGKKGKSDLKENG